MVKRKKMSPKEYEKYINTKRKHLEFILYTEDGWMENKILDEIHKRSSVKKFALMLHNEDVSSDTGQPVKLHYHVYLNFGDSSWTIAEVAKWFDVDTHLGSHIESNQYSTLLYYTHQKYPEKHQYPVENFVANFDVADFLVKQENAHESKKKEELIKKCAAGEITQLNFTQHIDPVTYVKHLKDLKGAWEYWECSQRDKEHPHNIIFVYGGSGLGKTFSCKLYAKALGYSSYLVTAGKNPFDKYRGEEAIILDDIRPNMPFNFKDLLLLLDGNNSNYMPARYDDKFTVAPLYFITTILSPEEFWADAVTANKEPAHQFYRRMNEIWRVTQDQIHISEYNGTDFQLRETVDNPVPAYLATHGTKAEPLDSYSVFGKLNAEIAAGKEGL